MTYSAKEVASEVEGNFETATVRNLVLETLSGATGEYEILRKFLDVKEDVYALQDEAESEELESAAFSAGNGLYEVEQGVIDRGIAVAMGGVLECGDEAAREEAREWIMNNPEPAKAVGVYADVMEGTA